MIKYLYLLCLATLVGCASNPPSNSNLGVIDLSGDYPIRRVDLKEIADVEYVPLETTDSSLLTSMCKMYCISEKYIITKDRYTGDLFFFTRSGKFIRKINRMGNGPEEYVSLQNLAIDFETEECLIYDLAKKKVHIYSFEGVYKRSFPWMFTTSLHPWYNLNKDYLIGHNGAFSRETMRCKDAQPFYIMSKKDGALTPLDLKVPDGIPNALKVIKEKLGSGETYQRSAFLPINPLFVNGDEALIADFSLDTLYSYKEGLLTPIAIQTPSVRSTTPPTIIAPELYTDSYLFFRIISMYYNESDYFKPYDEAVRLVWNRKVNQVEKWEIFNSDIDGPITRYPLAEGDTFADRNMATMLYTPETLIELNNEGKLKGKLKEVALKLDEEDNYVLLIAKYK